ncbi:MAG: M1 family metallopeptidase, partial [Thermoplasmata archaeon]
PPRRLTLDATRLEISTIEVNGRPTEFVHRREELDLTVPTGAAPARVRVAFRGRIEPRGMIGMYRSRAGSDHILTTQCGPIGARRIFPCFDRPDRKARFRVRVSTDADREVVFNTDPLAVEQLGQRKRWTFAPTPSMATYLFYLGIGRFDRVRDRSGRIAFSVITSPGDAESGRYALGLTGPLVRFFEEYYGLPYPLDKLDLIAIDEHPFGAMENWGVISFRTMRLLLGAASGEFDRRLISNTIAHELAHQWFGNLVTLRWWDDVWLNESFATFASYGAIDHVDPSHQAIHEFFVIEMGRALPIDSLATTVPIHQPVARAEDISSAFDPYISYGKGSSVLRMIHAYLGEERFRRGVTRYLKAHAGGNAETRDLWEALEAESGEAIPQILGPWVERPGL